MPQPSVAANDVLIKVDRTIGKCFATNQLIPGLLVPKVIGFLAHIKGTV